MHRILSERCRARRHAVASAAASIKAPEPWSSPTSASVWPTRIMQVSRNAPSSATRARVRGCARRARREWRAGGCGCNLSLRAVAPFGTALVGAEAGAVTLPDDQAEAMVHVYEADGLRATGSGRAAAQEAGHGGVIAGQHLRRSGQQRVHRRGHHRQPLKGDAQGVQRRGDYVYRDSQVTVSTTQSTEPDYKARSLSVDVAQDMFGNMTTVSLGFSRGPTTWAAAMSASSTKRATGATGWAHADPVAPTGWPRSTSRRWPMTATWATPIARPAWAGPLCPRTTPHLLQPRARLGTVGALAGAARCARPYRYFWDNWAIRAHTVEAGYSRVSVSFLIDGPCACTRKARPCFTATTRWPTRSPSRNRQLSSFKSVGPAPSSPTRPARSARRDIKLSAAYQPLHFKYSDFTDLAPARPMRSTPTCCSCLPRPASEGEREVRLVDPCDCGGGNGGGGPACLGGRRRAQRRGGGPALLRTRPAPPRYPSPRPTRRGRHAEVIPQPRPAGAGGGAALPASTQVAVFVPWTWARCSSSTRCS